MRIVQIISICVHFENGRKLIFSIYMFIKNYLYLNSLSYYLMIKFLRIRISLILTLLTIIGVDAQSFQQLGDKTFNSTPRCFSTDPAGNFYVLSANVISKWNGDSWIDLPKDLPTQNSAFARFNQMTIDKTGKIYITYTDFDQYIATLEYNKWVLIKSYPEGISNITFMKRMFYF